MISDAVYEHAIAERDEARRRADWLYRDCEEKHRELKAAEADRDRERERRIALETQQISDALGFRDTVLEQAVADRDRYAAAIDEYAWMGFDDEVERGDLQRAFRALAALNNEAAR